MSISAFGERFEEMFKESDDIHARRQNWVKKAMSLYEDQKPLVDAIVQIGESCRAITSSNQTNPS